MKLPLKTPMTLFARIVGENNVVRELQAILDTGASYVSIPAKDAIHLGFFEPYFDVPGAEEVAMPAVAFGAIVRGAVVTLREVIIGELSAKNVEAVICDQPEQAGGIQMILGTSFLKNFKVTLDYKKGEITIEG